ncbi:MAG: AAA family ATPase, partial [Chloroflexota bacterium]|nr:AAA family ATPase [Chloroflexota bacterium]
MPSQVQEIAARLCQNVERVLVGKRSAIQLAVVALLCEGHVLIEDVPGIGKTTLARGLAQSIGGTFRRIQCTPDLLPTDVTGVSVFDQRTAEFVFRPGPVFSNVLLADEINRATPRTQSAVLEAMQEAQVSVDGITRPLPRPFVVLATQNPVELEGTFPLPEAQLDRFLVRLGLG